MDAHKVIFCTLKLLVEKELPLYVEKLNCKRVLER